MDNQSTNLFMVLVGCKPSGRFTEQHDIFFGAGKKLVDLKSDLIDFWPEVQGDLHVDAWRCVRFVDNYEVKLETFPQVERPVNLYFINLGGYKPGYFGEPHFMMLVAAINKAEAIKRAKETEFYTSMGFPGAVSHIDDKYALDVDDIYELEEVLNPNFKSRFYIHLNEVQNPLIDEINLGYLPLKKLS